ncbi:hypothetical protein FJZ21_02470 [Candidatus Pacearchaeota archaeon]|nr:hypothetical protein [Candidatus Pacearchaeota archaeon]
MVIGNRKKGDVTISTIILIVLGLAVLVMMIIGFTKGWDFLFGAFDNAPSDLQTLAKACVVYAQGGLSIDFCQHRLVGKELVNCQDKRFKSELDGLTPPGCDPNLDKIACNNPSLISSSKRNDTMVVNSTGDLVGCKSFSNP